MKKIMMALLFVSSVSAFAGNTALVKTCGTVSGLTSVSQGFVNFGKSKVVGPEFSYVDIENDSGKKHFQVRGTATTAILATAQINTREVCVSGGESDATQFVVELK